MWDVGWAPQATGRSVFPMGWVPAMNTSLPRLQTAAASDQTSLLGLDSSPSPWPSRTNRSLLQETSHWDVSGSSGGLARPFLPEGNKKAKGTAQSPSGFVCYIALLLLFCLLHALILMCVHMYIYATVHMQHHRTICRNYFSPSSQRVPGTQFGLSTLDRCLYVLSHLPSPGYPLWLWQIANKRNSRRRGFIFGSQSEGTLHHGGEGVAAGDEAASHSVSTVSSSLSPSYSVWDSMPWHSDTHAQGESPHFSYSSVETPSLGSSKSQQIDSQY